MTITEKPLSSSDTRVLLAQIQGHTKDMHLLAVSSTVQADQETINSLIIPVPGSQSRVIIGDTDDTRIALRHLLANLSAVDNPVDYEPAGYTLQSRSAAKDWGATRRTTLEFDRIMGFVEEFYPGYELLTATFLATSEPQTIEFAVLYTPDHPQIMQMPTLHADGVSVTLGEIPVSYDAIATTRTVPTSDNPSAMRVQEILFQLRADEVATRHFEGWHNNADTFAATQNVDSCCSEVIVRKPFSGLWHG